MCSSSLCPLFLLPLLFSSMNSDELDFAFIVRRKQYQIRGFWQLQEGELFVSILSAAVAADVWRDFICDRGRHHAQTHTNRRVQTHDGGGSRTLQTSVLQACLHLHMPRLLHVSSLWSVYLQENLEGGKMLRVSFWAQTCSLHIDVFIVVFIISNASSLCSKPGFLHV